MHRIATLHFRSLEPCDEEVELLGQTIRVRHLSCDGDLETIAAQIAAFAVMVKAIALQGVARQLRLGAETLTHAGRERLFAIAQQIAVVDGHGVRAALERLRRDTRARKGGEVVDG